MCLDANLQREEHMNSVGKTKWVEVFEVSIAGVSDLVKGEKKGARCNAK